MLTKYSKLAVKLLHVAIVSSWNEAHDLNDSTKPCTHITTSTIILSTKHDLNFPVHICNALKNVFSDEVKRRWNCPKIKSWIIWYIQAFIRSVSTLDPKKYTPRSSIQTPTTVHVNTYK